MKQAKWLYNSLWTLQVELYINLLKLKVKSPTATTASKSPDSYLQKK